jgi:putative phage-type endonuclease
MIFNNNIILDINNNMDNIQEYKEILFNFNNTYNISSLKDLEKLIKYIHKSCEKKNNITENDLKKIFSLYSYIYNEKIVLDTEYCTFNKYSDFEIYFNNKKLPIRHNTTKNPLFGPYGTDWIHDIQKDDVILDIEKKDIKRRKLQFEKLNSKIYPAQRSQEWYIQRDGKITASDAGVVIGENKYEQPYKMILKKTRETFQNNQSTYHGKKYEDIAKLIYEYRMNVIIKEFGMVEHPLIKCIGASPDGIVTPYKNDNVHLTKFVGRMLEIKVPLSRQICKYGNIKGDICPIYYWDQVQLQMECCDLDECDFWQCTICEYPNKEIFIDDTCKSEQFRSKTTSFEKGVLIQILPSDKIYLNYKSDENYLNNVYEYAKFIYPPKIEMNPFDCESWVQSILANLKYTHSDYSLDKVIYWYLKVSHCVTIYRDKKWFESNKHKYEKMWEDIILIRENEINKKLFLNFIDSTKLGDRDPIIETLRNKYIFMFIEKLHKNKNIDTIIKFIDKNNKELNLINKKKDLEEKLNIIINELEFL